MNAALAAACLIHEVPLLAKFTITQPTAEPVLQATDTPTGRSHTPTHPQQQPADVCPAKTRPAFGT